MSYSNDHQRPHAVLLSLPLLSLLCAASAWAAPVVPWLNQPVAPRAAPLAMPAPSVHPCAAASLRIVAGASGAWRGQATQEIRLTNTGLEACHLPGFPSAQLQPAGAAPQAVAASVEAPQLAGERLELAPGAEALMLLGTPGSCEASGKPQRKVSKRLQLALPGGGLRQLDGVHVDTLCGRASVLRFERVEGEAAPMAQAQRAGAALQRLTGSISVAQEAARGGLLRYVVTLTNPTPNPVSLATCPAYTQSLYAGGKAADSTLRLNCAGAGGVIAANASVSFAMQAQVPSDLAPGELKLSWKLDDGPGAGTLVGLR